MTIRRLFLAALAALLLPAHAQESAEAYPAKPIRMIIPFAPGGGTDLTGRAIAQKLSEMWGQPVVVENKAGANGTIGLDLVAKAAPDGYTIGMITGSASVNVSLYRKLPYDLMRDLQPVTQATTQPYALVINPQLPVKNLEDLVKLSKSRPGGLNYGSSGTGGLSHLSGALLSSMTGDMFTHVPYKGGALAMTDVMGGQIDMLFSTIMQAHPYIQSGRLRAIAVTTPQRSPVLPDVPTLEESGVPGYEVAGWYGVVTTAGVPRPIVSKLNAAIVKILHMPDVVKLLEGDGSFPVGNTPEEFGAHIAKEVAKWREVLQKAKVKAE
ncbi:MAG TPA: tripartite tricarboxylate transporter substrate binding protein [Usitatibacter sp.]|nr:tripartite tricarboxylate transporter substrate binding protein [Usitatibacter sp.]